MSNLAVFAFDSQEIRFVDGKPVANDVAKVLGYKDPANAVTRIVKAANKGVCKLQTPRGVQSATVLEEAGIYQLIFSSKLPSSELFQQWVFSDVLPSIRKTGGYGVSAPEPKKAIAKSKRWDYTVRRRFPHLCIYSLDWLSTNLD